MCECTVGKLLFGESDLESVPLIFWSLYVSNRNVEKRYLLI